MNDNQTQFEIIRDLIPLIGSLKDGETIAIAVTKQNASSFYSCTTSKGMDCRSSELARALRETYEKFNGRY